MSTHVCAYAETNKKDVYACVTCRTEHRCGAEHCDSTFYNQDQTLVCTLTGECFGQRMCDAPKYSNDRLTNNEPVWMPPVKRPQQVNNRVLTGALINDLIDATGMANQIRRRRGVLVRQMLATWAEMMEIATEENITIRRKDNHSFVVAVLRLLDTGIFTASGAYVVAPHPNITVPRVNKKRSQESFNVSFIRRGHLFIKKIYGATRVSKCPVHLPDVVEEHDRDVIVDKPKALSYG